MSARKKKKGGGGGRQGWSNMEACPVKEIKQLSITPAPTSSLSSPTSTSFSRRWNNRSGKTI